MITHQLLAAAPNSTGAGVGFALLFLVWLFLMLTGVVGFVLMIVAIIDAARRPDWQFDAIGSSKLMWILLLVLINAFAIPSLIYLISIRKKLDAAIAPLGAGQQAGWYPYPGNPGQIAYFDGRAWGPPQARP